MTGCDGAVSAAAALRHRPLFDAEAGEIMHRLDGLSAAELAREVKLSMPLASRLCGMICEFPDKRHGARAIEAFTGVVFKALDYGSLPEAARRRAVKRVRLVSSLYGWLRPDDIIKPYRFDFTSKVGPTPALPAGGGGYVAGGDDACRTDRVPLASWWQSRVTDALLDELAATGEREILNLLPGDAARCFDWKRIGAVARVVKADFVETAPGGAQRTPNSNMLKTLRGRLLRQIVSEGVRGISGLLTLSSESYMARKEQTVEGCIVFDTVAE